MAEARWLAGLYLRLVGARVRAQLQYRLSFALDLLGTALISFIDFLGIVVLFSHLPRLAGWSLPEVGFFYGTASLAFALCDLVIGHLDDFPQTVRDGTFDLVLIRPAGSLFQVIASDLSLRRIGKALQGLAVLLFALSRLHIPWTPARALMLVAMVPAGAVIYAAVWIAAITVTFWAVQAREVSSAFTYGGNFISSYPINIFGPWVRRFLAFVIPMAFVSYFPGLFVLDRPDPLHAPAALQLCTPLVACLAGLVAARIWLFGVRHYRSTGS